MDVKMQDIHFDQDWNIFKRGRQPRRPLTHGSAIGSADNQSWESQDKGQTYNSAPALLVILSDECNATEAAKVAL